MGKGKRAGTTKGSAVEQWLRFVRVARCWLVGLVFSVLILGAGAARAVRPRARLDGPVVVLPASLPVRVLPPPRLARRSHPYGWPIFPFNQAHLVRGGFGDPRFGAYQRNFHFGIDIPAAGGTPVYAVAPGTVYLEPDHVDVLARVSQRASGFSYWHIYAAVQEHEFVRRHALLGWVKPVWGHLHFSEIEHGRYVNPLRPHALTPPPPPLKPTIAAVEAAPTAAGTSVDAGYSGRIAVVANVYATPAVQPPPPWQNAVLAPSLIRWRLLQNGRPLSDWQTAVDFRNYIPPDWRYPAIYARGTRPNRPNRAGTYLYYLARDWNLDALPAGDYQIQVRAVGTRGKTTTTTITLEIAMNALPARLGDTSSARPSVLACARSAVFCRPRAHLSHR